MNAIILSQLWNVRAEILEMLTVKKLQVIYEVQLQTLLERHNIPATEENINAILKFKPKSLKMTYGGKHLKTGRIWYFSKEGKELHTDVNEIVDGMLSVETDDLLTIPDEDDRKVIIEKIDKLISEKTQWPNKYLSDNDVQSLLRDDGFSATLHDARIVINDMKKDERFDVRHIGGSSKHGRTYLVRRIRRLINV